MGYITNTDIEDRLGTLLYIQLSDDAGAGSADLDVINAARVEAEGEADSYLARRYAVPIDLALHTNVSGLIKGFVLDLVEYRLHTRRPPVTADVVAKHDRAVAWFEALGRGDVVLPSLVTIPANTATGVAAQTVGDERVLSREELSAY